MTWSSASFDAKLRPNRLYLQGVSIIPPFRAVLRSSKPSRNNRRAQLRVRRPVPARDTTSIGRGWTTSDQRLHGSVIEPGARSPLGRLEVPAVGDPSCHMLHLVGVVLARRWRRQGPAFTDKERDRLFNNRPEFFEHCGFVSAVTAAVEQSG